MKKILLQIIGAVFAVSALQTPAIAETELKFASFVPAVF